MDKSIFDEIDALDADSATKSRLKESYYLFGQAEQALIEKRTEDCAKILETLLESNPSAAYAKELLAAAYMLMGYPVKAIRLLEELLESEPDDAKFSEQLAYAYHMQGWTQKALKQFKTTVSLDPINSKAWERLVECSISAEDWHEAKMNCFGAIYSLKEEGVESPLLYAFAFYIAAVEDENDRERAEKYLNLILGIIKDDDERDRKKWQYIMEELLDTIDACGCYEYLAHVKEIAGLIPNIDDSLLEEIDEIEKDAEIVKLRETYPEVLQELIETLEEGCGCENCANLIMSTECSILCDYEGYLPEITRLSEELPNLYAIHGEFFDEATSSEAASFNNREKMFFERVKKLSLQNLEPILKRADGSIVNPKVETFRRESPKTRRNEPCPCGSGKKFKKCCGM